MNLVSVRSICLLTTSICTLSVAAAIIHPAAAQTDREVQLEKRVEQLEKELQEMKELMKSMPQSGGDGAIPKKVTRSGSDDVTLTVSGQVNRAILLSNDGKSSDAFFVDNDNSSTRVRFDGRGKIDDDLSVGARVEVQFESNSTAAVNQFNGQRGVGPNNFTERKLEVWVDSKTFGRLWLGQGDTASNGTSEVDLSGTTVVGYSAVNDLAGGLLFVRDNPPAGVAPLSLVNPTIGGVFSNLDGLSRDDRVRYDTPKFFGFQLSGSWIADDRRDVALRHASEFGPVKIASAIAFSHIPANRNQINGSVSALHTPTGLNLTFAAGEQFGHAIGSNPDPSFWYAKAGWLFDAFAWGATAIAIDYGQYDDIAANGDEAWTIGGMFVQNIDRAGTELYVGIRNHALDRPGADFNDILAVLAGARVKF